MYDLYANDTFEDMSNPPEYEEVFSQLKQLDKKLRKLKKKKKGGKKGKKKKIERRIKALELQHEQMRQFLVFTARQLKANLKSQQSVQWKDTISCSLPQALELATAVVNRLPERRQSQLLLTDKKEKH